MSFFQNPFDAEFVGVLVLGDRQYSPHFKCKGNTTGVGQLMSAYNREPYNLTGKTIFTINYSFNAGKSWTALAIDLSTGGYVANIAAANVLEIITALNANATFATLYLAQSISDKDGSYWLQIKALRPRGMWKTYISNSSAESVLRFNKKAGVAEIPTFFARHTIANNSVYSDSMGLLIQLDTSNAIDQQIITDAGLDYTTVQADWQLLRGRSGLFTFKTQALDGSSRTTKIIEYPAGAKAGDFAKRTDYTYTGAGTVATGITEQPYVLTAGDLITPPLSSSSSSSSSNSSSSSSSS